MLLTDRQTYDNECIGTAVRFNSLNTLKNQIETSQYRSFVVKHTGGAIYYAQANNIYCNTN